VPSAPDERRRLGCPQYVTSFRPALVVRYCSCTARAVGKGRCRRSRTPLPADADETLADAELARGIHGCLTAAELRDSRQSDPTAMAAATVRSVEAEDVQGASGIVRREKGAVCNRRDAVAAGTALLPRSASSAT